ncbi:centromere protein O isoform X2 [Latimeria chalumnae]
MVAEMKWKIQELRARRDELRVKVKARSGKPIGEFGSGEAMDGSLDTSQISQQQTVAILNLKVETARSMLQAYSLTGISAKLTTRGACFCFSTAHEGTYLDTYYLDLFLRNPTRVGQHNIPLFIPLEQLAKKHLQTDLKQFLLVLSHHLNAYASRKYQADRFQEDFGTELVGPLQRNSLCNLLLFDYMTTAGGERLRCNSRLLYADATRWLPTQVDLTCKGDQPPSVQEKLSAHTALFQSTALHEAFKTIQLQEGAPGAGCQRPTHAVKPDANTALNAAARRIHAGKLTSRDLK